MREKMYEVHKKVCRTTGEAVEVSMKESSEDPEEYMAALVDYGYSITKDIKEEK